MHSNATLPELDEPIGPGELARIGVSHRGWASEHEGIAEMAVIAARRALARAEVAADELDLVILAKLSSNAVPGSAMPGVLEGKLAVVTGVTSGIGAPWRAGWAPRVPRWLGSAGAPRPWR